jgi:hypothetical protein
MHSSGPIGEENEEEEEEEGKEEEEEEEEEDKEEEEEEEEEEEARVEGGAFETVSSWLWCSVKAEEKRDET